MLVMKLDPMPPFLSFLLLLMLLSLAGPAGGSHWFQVIDISPIQLAAHEEANFSVQVKGLGSQGAYVELVFRNESQGLNVSCPRLIKYVFPAGVTKYNCTVRAGDLAPGNYSFVVDVAAAGSPSGKRTAYVEVLALPGLRSVSAGTDNASKISPTLPNQTSAAREARGSPGAGAFLAALIILGLWRRRH